MEQLLKDQIAVVTGSTAGIGQAIAEKLADQGAWVAIIGTNAEKGHKIVSEINHKTGSDRAAFFSVDVCSTAAVDEIVKKD